MSIVWWGGNSPMTKKDIVWVAITACVIILIALAVWWGYCIGFSQKPSNDSQIIVKQEIITREIRVTVTPTPEPTRIFIPRPTPTPKLRMVLERSDLISLLQIDFNRAISGIPLEERALILGRENPKWKSSSQKEIVYNAVKFFQRIPEREVILTEGTFDRFIYTQDGVTYLAENVSVNTAVEFLKEKNIAAFAGTFINPEGKEENFVFFYKGDLNNGMVIAAGEGTNLKVNTLATPGSDIAGGGSTDPGSSSSSGSSSSPGSSSSSGEPASARA